MQSSFAVNKYLHTVTSGWIFIHIEEEDNDYDEHIYDNDDDSEGNVDNGSLVTVLEVAHCIKYPEALVGFSRSLHENCSLLP